MATITGRVWLNQWTTIPVVITCNDLYLNGDKLDKADTLIKAVNNGVYVLQRSNLKVTVK